MPGSATTAAVWDVFVTGKLVVQFNQFLDPLLLSGDVGTFVTIEDENRNAVILHATRDIGRRLTAEARYAYYSNPFATEELAFSRHTVPRRPRPYPLHGPGRPMRLRRCPRESSRPTGVCATGAPDAKAVLAAAERGGLLHAPDTYMEKLVVGPTARGKLHLDAPAAENLRALARDDLAR